MIFYLGTHQPGWLNHVVVPLFVSRVRLLRYKTFPRAAGPWALDSGAFSEIDKHGRWTVSAEQYAEEVQRWQKEIGRMQWASVQDWMCETVMLEKTGLTVRDHQERTLVSYVHLRELAPSVPWVPVLQGFAHREYIDHLRQYEAAGIDLRSLPLVGVGSLCRRQATAAAGRIIFDLACHGLRLHGFGFKTDGLRLVGDVMESADSMAWSKQARKRPPLPECVGRHKSCANCLRYAMRWRENVIRRKEAEARIPEAGRVDDLRQVRRV